jgi:hypothetical protein
LRILIACIVIVAVGGILTAAYSLQPTKLDSVQLAQVNTNCAQCHSVPPLRNIDQLHNTHTFLDCSVCHGKSSPSGEVESADINSALCVRCHSIPQYSDAVSMHNSHSGADCAVCHTSDSGLITVTNTYKVVRIAGIALIILGILGIIINFVVTRIRLGKKG